MSVINLSEDEYDQLEHAGVKGMKWGKRKSKAERFQNRLDRGNARLDKNGGSATKAQFKTVGKVLAFNMATNLAATGVRSLTGPGSPASVGFTAVATLAQVGALGMGISEMRAVNTADNVRDSRG